MTRRWIAVAAMLAGLALPVTGTHAQPAVLSLDELLTRARSGSPLLDASRADELAARAGTVTARAYPNPELEFLPGRSSPRDGTAAGTSTQLSITQPLENPWLRESRLRAAESRVEVAGAQTGVVQSQLAAAIKRAYFDVLRLKDEVQAFGEDLQLTEQIRQRVQVRVRSGEAPRFDLVRADGEMAIAQKNLDTAKLRLRQALAELRRAVGPRLEPEFDVRAEPVALLAESDYQRLRDRVLAGNPDVQVAERELARAERLIEVERNAVLPQVSLRASSETDPTMRSQRIGAVVTIPILNRREGPIAEARAQAERSRLLLDQRRLETGGGFEAAWLGYRAAAAQVQALENGILERARAVVEIAEAAYRFGERGILEYLDAQRQFRLARNELIQARHAKQLARVELERLAGL